jgi:hypothetical protein
MKATNLIIPLALLLASCNIALAQHGASSESTTFSQIEDHFVSDAEKALVRIVEAMPEDKYTFAPTNGQFKGVRTFADMVKHVAASNYGMAAAILHEKSPVKLETMSDLDVFNDKPAIIKFLKGSFEFLHKALTSINEQNATELVKSPDSDKPLAKLEVADRAITHCWDHFGQMLEYLRMNGIVPPGSH